MISTTAFTDILILENAKIFQSPIHTKLVKIQVCNLIIEMKFTYSHLQTVEARFANKYEAVYNPVVYEFLLLILPKPHPVTVATRNLHLLWIIIGIKGAWQNLQSASMQLLIAFYSFAQN